MSDPPWRGTYADPQSQWTPDRLGVFYAPDVFGPDQCDGQYVWARNGGWTTEPAPGYREPDGILWGWRTDGWWLLDVLATSEAQRQLARSVTRYPNVRGMAI